MLGKKALQREKDREFREPDEGLEVTYGFWWVAF